MDDINDDNPYRSLYEDEEMIVMRSTTSTQRRRRRQRLHQVLVSQQEEEEDDDDNDDDDDDEEEEVEEGEFPPEMHEFLSLLEGRSKSELGMHIGERLYNAVNNLAEEYLPMLRASSASSSPSAAAALSQVRKRGNDRELTKKNNDNNDNNNNNNIVGHTLQIETEPELLFTLSSNEALPQCIMKLRHGGGTEEFIVFKIQTTQPLRYLVRPNQGLIAPGTSETISILLVEKDKQVLLQSYERSGQSGLDHYKDKFLVQSCTVNKTFAAKKSGSQAELYEAVTAMWKDINSGGSSTPLLNKKSIRVRHVVAMGTEPIKKDADVITASSDSSAIGGVPVARDWGDTKCPVAGDVVATDKPKGNEHDTETEGNDDSFHQTTKRTHRPPNSQSVVTLHRTPRANNDNNNSMTELLCTLSPNKARCTMTLRHGGGTEECIAFKVKITQRRQYRATSIQGVIAPGTSETLSFKLVEEYKQELLQSYEMLGQSGLDDYKDKFCIQSCTVDEAFAAKKSGSQAELDEALTALWENVKSGVSSTPSLYKKSIRVRHVVDSSLSLSTNSATTSASVRVGNQAPTLTKDGYSCNPPIVELQRMSPVELATVANFSVVRAGIGKVEWQGAVDVRGADLDAIVVIERKSIYFNTEDMAHSKVGTKLNSPAILTIENVFPKNPMHYLSLSKAREKFKRYIAERTMFLGAELINYDSDRGHWVYRVPHFGQPVTTATATENVKGNTTINNDNNKKILPQQNTLHKIGDTKQNTDNEEAMGAELIKKDTDVIAASSDSSAIGGVPVASVTQVVSFGDLAHTISDVNAHDAGRVMEQQQEDAPATSDEGGPSKTGDFSVPEAGKNKEAAVAVKPQEAADIAATSVEGGPSKTEDLPVPAAGKNKDAAVITVTNNDEGVHSTTNVPVAARDVRDQPVTIVDTNDLISPKAKKKASTLALASKSTLASASASASAPFDGVYSFLRPETEGRQEDTAAEAVVKTKDVNVIATIPLDNLDTGRVVKQQQQVDAAAAGKIKDAVGIAATSDEGLPSKTDPPVTAAEKIKDAAAIAAKNEDEGFRSTTNLPVAVRDVRDENNQSKEKIFATIPIKTEGSIATRTRGQRNAKSQPIVSSHGRPIILFSPKAQKKASATATATETVSASASGSASASVSASASTSVEAKEQTNKAAKEKPAKMMIVEIKRENIVNKDALKFHDNENTTEVNKTEYDTIRDLFFKPQPLKITSEHSNRRGGFRENVMDRLAVPEIEYYGIARQQIEDYEAESNYIKAYKVLLELQLYDTMIKKLKPTQVLPDPSWFPKSDEQPKRCDQSIYLEETTNKVTVIDVDEMSDDESPQNQAKAANIKIKIEKEK